MYLVYGLVGMVAFAVLTVGLRKAHRFKYRPTVLALAEIESLKGGGWQSQEHMSADGVSIVGLVHPPANSNVRWILFFPGNGGNLLKTHRGALESLLPDSDWGFSMWAYRGFDASQGQVSPVLADADALEAFAKLQSSHGVAGGDIHIIGYSLGSCVASRLAASLADRGTPAGSLSLIAYADQIPVMQWGLLGGWKSDHIYDSVGIAAAIPGPVLLLHGTEDDQLDLQEGDGLRMALGEKAVSVVIAGANHTSILGSEEAIGALFDFLGP